MCVVHIVIAIEGSYRGRVVRKLNITGLWRTDFHKYHWTLMRCLLLLHVQNIRLLKDASQLLIISFGAYRVHPAHPCLYVASSATCSDAAYGLVPCVSTLTTPTANVMCVIYYKRPTTSWVAEDSEYALYGIAPVLKRPLHLL